MNIFKIFIQKKMKSNKKLIFLYSQKKMRPTRGQYVAFVCCVVTLILLWTLKVDESYDDTNFKEMMLLLKLELEVGAYMMNERAARILSLSKVLGNLRNIHTEQLQHQFI